MSSLFFIIFMHHLMDIFNPVFYLWENVSCLNEKRQ